MEIKAKTFRKLYELVVEKLLKEFEGHDLGDFDTESSTIWKRQFKEREQEQKKAFEKKYGTLYGSYISKALFDMDAKNTYFYLAYKGAEGKQGTISILDKRLYRAFLYLKHTTPLTIDEIKAFQNISAKKIKAETFSLKDEFEKKCDTSESNSSHVKEIIVSNEYVKYIDSSFDLITNFFNFVNSMDKFSGWLLLHPDLQKELWDHDFNEFCKSFSDFISIDFIFFRPLTIEWNSILSILAYEIVPKVYDFQGLLTLANLKSVHKAEYDISNKAKKEVSLLNMKLKKLNKKRLQEMSEEEMNSFEFLNLVRRLNVLSNDRLISSPSAELKKKVKGTISGHIVTVYSYHRWLISEFTRLPLRFKDETKSLEIYD